MMQNADLTVTRKQYSTAKYSKNSQIRQSAVLFATSPYCQITANQRRPFVGHLSQARDLAASVGINLGRHTSPSSCTKCRPQFSSKFACVRGKRKKTLASLSQFLICFARLSTNGKGYCIAVHLPARAAARPRCFYKAAWMQPKISVRSQLA